MPALVKRTLGSSFRMSGQLGIRVWPFSSKKVMNRSRMVALSISALLGAGGQSPPTAKRKRGSPPPAPRVPLHESLLGVLGGEAPRTVSGLRGGASSRVARSCSSCARVPLTLGLVDELLALHRGVVHELLRDLLQVVRALLQLFGADAQLLTRDVACLRRVEERGDRAGQQAEDEAHALSPSSFDV